MNDKISDSQSESADKSEGDVFINKMSEIKMNKMCMIGYILSGASEYIYTHKFINNNKTVSVVNDSF